MESVAQSLGKQERTKYNTCTKAMSSELMEVDDIEWRDIISTVQPEIMLSPLFVIAVHRNMQDILLSKENDNCKNRKRFRFTTKHQEEVTSLAVMADGAIFLTGGADNMVYQWFIDTTGTQIKVKCVGEITFKTPIQRMSPHPRHILIAVVLQGNNIHLRHLASEVDEICIQIKDCNVTAISQGESTLIYSTDQGRVYIWHYETPDDMVRYYQASSFSIRCLSLRKDYVVTWGLRDTFIHVWNMVTGKTVVKLTLSGGLSDLKLSPDGNHVIMTGQNDHVVFYQVSGSCYDIFHDPPPASCLAVDDVYVYILSHTGTLHQISYKAIGRNKSKKREPSTVNMEYTVASKADVTKIPATTDELKQSSSTCKIL